MALNYIHQDYVLQEIRQAINEIMLKYGLGIKRITNYDDDENVAYAIIKQSSQQNWFEIKSQDILRDL